MKLLVFPLTILWLHATNVRGECPPDVLVMYRMVLHTEWSEENFPKQYPEWRPPAQWSVVVGRSHNSSGVLWRLGETASDSLKLFVETGRADLFIREGAEEKKGILSEFFAPPVLQGVGMTEAKFFVDIFHPKVSIICRITPSPDWFIGVDSFDLCRGNKWADSITLDLEPIDGGTDNGYTFTSPKWATDPRSSITPIRSNVPDHPASSFFYPELEKLPRIAYVKILKMKEFFLTKQIIGNLKGESLTFDSAISTSTRAGVISPMNELKKFPIHSKKIKKDRKRKEIEARAFSSKSISTEKSKIRLYKQNRPRPCRVSEWADWEQCNNSCGFGEQIRKRKVTNFPLRGGRPCPPLQESRWCRVPIFQNLPLMGAAVVCIILGLVTLLYYYFTCIAVALCIRKYFQVKWTFLCTLYKWQHICYSCKSLKVDD